MILAKKSRAPIKAMQLLILRMLRLLPGSRLWDNATSSRAGALLSIRCQVNTASEAREMLAFVPLGETLTAWCRSLMLVGPSMWLSTTRLAGRTMTELWLQSTHIFTSSIQRRALTWANHSKLAWYGAPQNVYRLGTAFFRQSSSVCSTAR